MTDHAPDCERSRRGINCTCKPAPDLTEQAIADLLGAHREQGMTGDGIMSDGEVAWLRCSCGWQENLYLDYDDITLAVAAWEAHLAALLAERVRGARAEALREAADAFDARYADVFRDVFGRKAMRLVAVLRILRARADHEGGGALG